MAGKEEKKKREQLTGVKVYIVFWEIVIESLTKDEALEF